jgi:hypothetical protein
MHVLGIGTMLLIGEVYTSEQNVQKRSNKCEAEHSGCPSASTSNEKLEEAGVMFLKDKQSLSQKLHKN